VSLLTLRAVKAVVAVHWCQTSFLFASEGVVGYGMQGLDVVRALRQRFQFLVRRGVATKTRKQAPDRAEKPSPAPDATSTDQLASEATETTWSALNIVKGETGPPKQPLSAYPEWLWTLLSEEKNVPLRVLQERFESLRSERGLQEAVRLLGSEQLQRLLKLANRAAIKQHNTERKRV
jgi:hypothetical protein